MPPATTYDTVSATLTNGASMTDPLFAVDLADMTSAWWAAVDTSDGTKGRVYTSTGTELACDWIDFNSGTQTGQLRVKWSGTVLAGGSVTLHVYPPVAANASVGVSDTYGQYNAYPATLEVYLPLGGSLDDRTGNGRDATVNSGVPDPVATAKFGGGYDFERSNPDSMDSTVPTMAAATVLAWIKPESLGSAMCITGQGFNDCRLRVQAGGYVDFTLSNSGTTTSNLALATPGDWTHVVGCQDASAGRIHLNGTDRTDAGSGDATASLSGTLRIAARGSGTTNNFDGVIDELQVYSEVRSADQIALEYQMTAGSFWTITNVPLPTGSRRVMMVA